MRGMRARPRAGGRRGSWMRSGWPSPAKRSARCVAPPSLRPAPNAAGSCAKKTDGVPLLRRGRFFSTALTRTAPTPVRRRFQKVPPSASLVWLNASADPGFDIGLVNAMKSAVSIPVIASSGAGSAQHFVECFEQTPVEAALAVRLPPPPAPRARRLLVWSALTIDAAGWDLSPARSADQ